MATKKNTKSTTTKARAAVNGKATKATKEEPSGPKPIRLAMAERLKALGLMTEEQVLDGLGNGTIVAPRAATCPFGDAEAIAKRLHDAVVLANSDGTVQGADINFTVSAWKATTKKDGTKGQRRVSVAAWFDKKND